MDIYNYQPIKFLVYQKDGYLIGKLELTKEFAYMYKELDFGEKSEFEKELIKFFRKKLNVNCYLVKSAGKLNKCNCY